MKKFIPIIVTVSFLASLAIAGCENAYNLKAEKMLPKSTVAAAGLTAGTFLVVGGAMVGTIVVGAGPVGILAITPLVAYSRKVERVRYFSNLIKSVNVQSSTSFVKWSVPKVETFLGDFQTAGSDNSYIGQTIFDRIRDHVLRESGNVTDQQIAEAIYKANLKDEFCLNDEGKADLKMSVKSFVKVISSNI